MKFSIITVVFNGSKTIAQCIDSVIAQDYPNIEYIIIDGNSTDGTQEIVKSYGEKISVFISEKDKGLYDAMNKGVQAASGDIIGIVNADDFLAENNVISNIAMDFEKHQTDAVCSSVKIYKDEDFGKAWRFYNAEKFKLWQFRIGIQPPHPGFYVKKEFYEKLGLYDIEYRISGDFDLMLRMIYLNKLKTHYTSFTSVKMRDGGISSRDLSSKILMNKEDHRALKKYGFKSSLILIWFKYLFKIFQLI